MVYFYVTFYPVAKLACGFKKTKQNKTNQLKKKPNPNTFSHPYVFKMSSHCHAAVYLVTSCSNRTVDSGTAPPHLAIPEPVNIVFLLALQE